MGIISHCRKWPVQLWFLTPRSSQCLQMLFYCMEGLIAWYFRKTEQIHLPFCMLSRKNLVVTIWLPLLHRSALDGLLCCSQHWLALVQLNTSEVLESCNIMFQAALSLGARSADKPATEPALHVCPFAMGSAAAPAHTERPADHSPGSKAGYGKGCTTPYNLTTRWINTLSKTLLKTCCLINPAGGIICIFLKSSFSIVQLAFMAWGFWFKTFFHY